MSLPSKSSSSNNHSSALPRDTIKANSPRTNSHDPTYYYPDGSVVFLVENVLFKLQASLILPPNSISSISGDGSQRYPTGVENLPRQLTKSSDKNPITLSNVTASQFRNYLFALLGSPSDPSYLGLLTDAKDSRKHNRDLLVRYLDISCLARQFGKSELEKWARSQLRLVLRSMYNLAGSDWDKDTLFRLNSYARSTGIGAFISSTRTFIEYFISISADKASGQGLASSNLNTCAEIYKDPSLPEDDPALFGCVFASILALGHQSTIWKSSITQKDRAMFYAAQVQLISLSDQLRSVDWLQSATHPLPGMEGVCGQCQSRFEDLWQTTFGKCKGLKSAIPLRDVTALARLPQYRQSMVSRWTTPNTCATLISRRQSDPNHRQTESWGAAPLKVAFMPYEATKPASFRVNSKECPKLKLLDDIDRRIHLVYTELARRYKDIVLASET